MPVYVDPLFTMESKNAQAFAVGARNGHRWCHMFADTREELEALARRIGMRPSWYQPDSEGGHYDLTPSRRAAAVAAGAQQVTEEEACNIWSRNRTSQLILAMTGGAPRVCGAAVLMALDDNRLWLAERVPHPCDPLDDGTYWTGPASSVPAGEHPHAAAVRLVGELAGLVVKPWQMKVRHASHLGESALALFFIVRLNERELPQQTRPDWLGPWELLTPAQARQRPLLVGLDGALAKLAPTS